MANFVAIACGLDVAPALAELAGQDWRWFSPNDNALQAIHLLSGDLRRESTGELPALWTLIDSALAAIAASGDAGALCYCRLGRMPPGAGIPLHRDGIDGVSIRRYQLALAAETGVAITIDGETRCFVPGELWRIDVRKPHSVRNASAADRITLVLDTKY